LEQLKNQNFHYFFNLISPLCDKLHDRFKNYFNLSHQADDAILATYFHPLFKMRWIPEGLTEADKNRMLCINAAKQINITGNEISTSDVFDDEGNLLICMSPKRSKASTDSSRNSNGLQILQFFHDKNKSLKCLNNYPVKNYLFVIILIFVCQH